MSVCLSAQKETRNFTVSIRQTLVCCSRYLQSPALCCVSSNSGLRWLGLSC